MRKTYSYFSRRAFDLRPLLSKTISLWVLSFPTLWLGGCSNQPESAGDIDLPASRILSLKSIGERVRVETLDGDNWPVTWSSDGFLYTGYGDGWGTRNREHSVKLNTGLVKIEGAPPNIEAHELALPWFGKGAEDPNIKGTGIIEVDGTIYHFLRYQAGDPSIGRKQIAAGLIWSRDGAKSWGGMKYAEMPEKIDFFFGPKESRFAMPFFLQAGQGYKDWRDEYVYIYSPNEGRRNRNDSLNLARAHKNSITDRSAYEFFAGLDKENNPIWSNNINSVSPVLIADSYASIGTAVYIKQLDRIVLATACRRSKSPSSLLILEAPNPWGPWSTVGHVEKWGSGQDGDFRYEPRLPAKWIKGNTMIMVYSDRILSDKFNYQTLHFSINGEL